MIHSLAQPFKTHIPVYCKPRQIAIEITKATVTFLIKRKSRPAESRVLAENVIRGTSGLMTGRTSVVLEDTFMTPL